MVEPLKVNTDSVSVSEAERRELVNRKVTCPFVGTAVATGTLPIRNSALQPLASIADVVSLGNEGGGDLGNLIAIFAKGNHAFMPGNSGKFDRPAPAGLFSLDFPGSQGSHPGHSGILQGNPNVLDSGRFSPEDFKRLTDKVRDGMITVSAVGEFIAENLVKDKDANVTVNVDEALLFTKALADALLQGPATLFEQLNNLLTGRNVSGESRELAEKVTKAGGQNDLIGSAGEFALLFAFFANRPGAQTVDSKPTLPVDDLILMFKEKQFPPEWKTWKKTASSWVTSTEHLVISAARNLETNSII